MLSFIIPFRNREVKYLRNSLESLVTQTDSKFDVFLIDYGSNPTRAKEVEKLCARFPFLNYQYCHTQFQPWNKSRALNFVIKALETEFCFVADVDMIFHPEFVSKAKSLQKENTTVYFQVGFLEPNEEAEPDDFTRNGIRKSNFEATGVSMLPVEPLKELRGFDEFYHFWGGEDTDMHVRLKNAGYPVNFYDREVLMLHQWHPSYRSKEKSCLTTDLQVSEIVQLNQQHLNFAIKNKITKVNPSSWGEIPSAKDFLELEKSAANLHLTNAKKEIDDLLYGQLPFLKNQIVKVIIKKDPLESSLKYRLRKLLRKKVLKFYNFKEVNDLVLLHIISNHRHRPYIFKLDEDFKCISFAIKL